MSWKPILIASWKPQVKLKSAKQCFPKRYQPRLIYVRNNEMQTESFFFDKTVIYSHLLPIEM